MQDDNSKSKRLNVERGILEVRRGRRQLRSGPESLERLKVLGSRKIVQRGSREEGKEQRRTERLWRMSRSLGEC